jgi:rhodanese-related sulfurtransferase
MIRFSPENSMVPAKRMNVSMGGRAQELDEKVQVASAEVHGWIAKGEDFSFLDLRNAEEAAANPVEGAELFDYNDSQRYMSLDKERKIVFLCQDGDRSLDVASYFAGHGFTAACAIRGGLSAWNADPVA